MAGGKLSARQKMINLMYLIFIAMLALNMSKEVLSAFGLMNERLTESNQAATERNEAFVSELAVKAGEQPEKYKPLQEKAHQIDVLANDLNDYLTNLKGEMTKSLDDPTDYEIMDKADFLDNYLFKGDKLKPEGEAFLNNIAAFRDGVVDILGDDPQFASITADVKKKFATDPVQVTGELKPKEWLDYHYRGFPLVASLTKMTQLQADIKTTESEVLGAMFQGKLTSEVSMTNYTTLLETSKSAYFNGEQFDGQIVLGRKDASTKPNRVELTLDGRALRENEYTIEDGKVKLNVNTGRPGEHKIEGKLIFLEDGTETEVPVSTSFATVPKPNSATISADKMNVLYRGVDNPMTISFAGIPDNKVKPTAQGIRRGNGDGKYIMNVTKVQGREITINVTGTLPDGKPVSDNAKFRIKDIPRPTGTVRGEDGSTKMQKGNLEISTIGAKLDDFDFELPLEITGFNFKVTGQPTVAVKGNKLDARAKQVLKKAKRGSSVQIMDIQARIKGNSTYKLKKVSPVFVELTN